MTKVLCVEDEQHLLEDYGEVLEECGYEVLLAGDGAQGLRMILEHKPDLVACDINMPVMDGRELFRKLRGEYPEYADMPFLFLTALADRQDVLDGINLGVDDYLTKPVDYELFTAKVAQRLGQVARMKEKAVKEMQTLYEALTAFLNRPTDGGGKRKLQENDGVPNITVVIIGKPSKELNSFAAFLDKNRYRVILYPNEEKYLVRRSPLSVHFLLAWNYSYDDYRSLYVKINNALQKCVVIPVYSRAFAETSMSESERTIENTIQLPVGIKTINEKFVELIRQRANASQERIFVGSA